MRYSFLGSVSVGTALLVAIGFAFCFCPSTARAQDSFEIRVEQYERPALGTFSFEEHFNEVGIGTSNFDGTVAPTNHQFHMSSELTAGITDHMSFGLMLMTATMPGQTSGLSYAGWRALPHFYAPDSWRLPVRVGLTAEFSFQRTTFEESPATIELRPIIEKTLGRAQFDLNPSFERSISSLKTPSRWGFEPSVRLAYDISPRLTPILEYFGAYGSLKEWRPLAREVHLLYPGADWKLASGVLFNIGVGVGMGSTGNRLVYKSRVEFSFPRRSKR